MSGINLLKPGQRWKAGLLVLATCAALLACGGLIGYAASRNKARQAGAQADTKQQQQQMTAAQLPFPDSTAARQLLADPAIPGWLHELYMHQQDSNLITAEHTEALLKQLQRALQALPPSPASVQSALSSSVSTASVSSLPATAAAEHLQLLSAYQNSHTVNPSSSSLDPSPAAGLQPFIIAAGDVLSYLRYKQSQALLPLLRSFSRSGLKGVAVLGSNPAVLRQEVQQLLQPASLQQWYVEAARSRVGAATPLQQQSTAFSGGDSSTVRPSHRRLMAAPADAPALDLTNALLSKMQGAPAHQATAAAHPVTASQPSIAYTTAAPAHAPAAVPAAVELSGGSAGLVQKATGSSVPSAGWVPARPAPVPAVVAGGFGASAVAEPDYLAFDFEDLGADGESFEEEEELADTSSSRSSTAKAHKQSGQPLGTQRAAAGARLATAPSNSWVRLQSEDSAPGLTPETEVTASPALQEAGSAQQRQRESLGADMPSSQSVPLQQHSGTQTEAQQSDGSPDSAALCGIQQFSPVGGHRGPESVSCPAPHLSYYSQGGWVLRPLTIPVIFHCLTFTRVLPSSVSAAGLGVEGPDAQVLLPPNWQASAAAGNLIDQANKAFANTDIQFKLQEVRHDPQKHSYLQQPNLESWQSCSYNAASPATGVACLSKVARQVEAAASPLALHVFVSGSRDERAYCANDAAAMGSVCRSVASGYSGARGPWKGPLASSSWREDVLAENFVFLSWDTFNPASANSVRFANRGGSIFASQLAQHLGLTPTTAPAAASSCGAQQQQQQLPALASWCSAFRQGRQPPTSELAAATGCPAAGGSFGVLEPSVLDNCAMSFSAGQVAALQAAVAMYRPKSHAAHVSQ